MKRFILSDTVMRELNINVNDSYYVFGQFPKAEMVLVPKELREDEEIDENIKVLDHRRRDGFEYLFNFANEEYWDTGRDRIHMGAIQVYWKEQTNKVLSCYTDLEF